MSGKVTQEQQKYLGRVKQLQPKRNLKWGMFHAFWVGGAFCALGECLSMLAMNCMNMTQKEAGSFVSMVLIFLGSLLTAIGVYDRIGSFAGAGSVVPITGFANSMVAPAMEFRHEGYITGVGGRLFSLAGPVIMYGLILSMIAGAITLIWG